MSNNPLKDRILDNQNKHHQLLADYFRVCETIRVAEIERDNLRLEIVSIAGEMNFVEQTRAEMRGQKEPDAHD